MNNTPHQLLIPFARAAHIRRNRFLVLHVLQFLHPCVHVLHKFHFHLLPRKTYNLNQSHLHLIYSLLYQLYKLHYKNQPHRYHSQVSAHQFHLYPDHNMHIHTTHYLPLCQQLYHYSLLFHPYPSFPSLSGTFQNYLWLQCFPLHHLQKQYQAAPPT